MRKNRLQSKPIEAVLFDLGKVIVDFNFEPAFKRLAKVSPLSALRIRDFFVSSGLEVLYDGGKISSRQFYNAVKKATSHSLSFAQFKTVWNEVFTLNKPIADLVRRLASRYRLVLISNTNSMHYDYVLSQYPVLKYFDQRVLSFKEKIRKPDRRIYKIAIGACRTSPEQIFYIDDRAEMTKAAKELGLGTFTFKNNTAVLLRKLREFRVRV